MNNIKTWAWLIFGFIGFIAIIATAYSLIPEGVSFTIHTPDLP